MTNEPNLQKLLHALGICAKARGLLVGTPIICEAMRGKTKPLLVVSAADNAENTQKKLFDKCAFYRVRIEIADVGGEQLAAAIGKHARVAAVAVTDEHLCRLVENTLKQLNTSAKSAVWQE